MRFLGPGRNNWSHVIWVSLLLWDKRDQVVKNPFITFDLRAEKFTEKPAFDEDVATQNPLNPNRAHVGNSRSLPLIFCLREKPTRANSVTMLASNDSLAEHHSYCT